MIARLAVAVLLAQPPALSPDAADLSIRWQPGASERFAMSLRIVGRRESVEANAPDAVWTLTNEGVFDRSVVEAAPAGRGPVVQIVWREIRAQLDAGVFRVRFDSAVDPATDDPDGPAAPLRALIGAPILIHFDEAGLPVRVESPPNMPDAGAWASLADNFSSTRPLLTLLEPALTPPGEGTKARLGESWPVPEQAIDGPSGKGALILSATRRLEESRGDRAVIEMSGEFRPAPAAPEAPAGADGGSLTGRIVWNTGAGVLERSEVGVSIVGRSPAPGGRGNRELVESRVTIRRLNGVERGLDAAGD